MVLLSEKRVKTLVGLLLFLTFDLMLLGAGVRTMDAGLTCPDWPLCFGKAIPEYHFGVYLEFIHRAIAGVLSLIFLFFYINVWKNPELKKIRHLSSLALFLLIAQVVMGGLTVLKLLDSIIVTFHLSLATSFLIVLYLIKQKLNADSRKPLKAVVSKVLPFLYKLNVRAGVVFVCIQIVLGGLVASTYSGLICVDFPTCNGQLFPPLTGPIAIQMFHRFGAYWLTFLGTLLFLFSMFASKSIGMEKRHRILSTQIFMLICTQVAVGVMNLKYFIPAWLSVVHLALALSILLHLLKLSSQFKATPYKQEA